MAESFWGYERADGQVGVRNHLLVMATCDCAYEEAKKVAAYIANILCYQHICEDH